MDRERVLNSDSNDTDRARVVTRLLADRFACRAYCSDSVPHDTILRTLSIAQLSASWCNTQPWQLTITEGEATKRFASALFEYANSSAFQHDSDFPFPEWKSLPPSIHHERRNETAGLLYGALGITRSDRSSALRQTKENFRLFGAPHIAIITTPRMLDTYGAVDCGIYVGNFMLTAQSFGVSTTPQAAIASCSGFVRKYFAIPDDRAVLCGISFGYADHDHPANAFRTPRAELGQAVEFINT